MAQGYLSLPKLKVLNVFDEIKYIIDPIFFCRNLTQGQIEMWNQK